MSVIFLSPLLCAVVVSLSFTNKTRSGSLLPITRAYFLPFQCQEDFPCEELLTGIPPSLSFYL